MPWHTHDRLTATARGVFRETGSRVKVRTNGRIFLLPDSPWGRLVILRVRGGYLVAAERPAPPLLAPGILPPSLAAELAAKGLSAWRLVPAEDCDEVIRSLAGDGQPLTAMSWSPYLVPIQKATRLIGENHTRLFEQLAALLDAQDSDGLVLHLFGPDGIGKRTIAAAVAERLGLTLAGELPLSRLLFDRALQYSVETVVDTLLVGCDCLGRDHLLVLSEAQLLDSIAAGLRDRVLLRELRRVPYRLLLTSPSPIGSGGVLSLGCPGLDSGDEAEQLVALVHPEVCFAGSAFRLLVAAASVQGFGVVPGRLLYLIKLAKAMLGRQIDGDSGTEEAVPQHAPESEVRHSTEVWLAPDEISAVAALVRSAWAERPREQSWGG